MGFIFLKKYCALLAGYGNKSAYTAPEHLVQKGQVVENPTEASDIYSFGIMLCQIVTDQVPFQNMSIADLKLEVVEDKSRPHIPPTTYPALADLIRECWHQVSDSRPSFPEIEDRLSNIISELKARPDR